MEKEKAVVISGSFRKHFEGINTVIKEFQKLGISVLSPNASKVVNPGEEFAILESDDNRNPKYLEQKHLDAIKQADALYIYNPNGYIGASATMELGWAKALEKPIYAKEEPEDFTLKLFISKVLSPEHVSKELSGNQKNFLKTINPNSSVSRLQEYIHKVVVQRGFDDESPRDIMLLMVEEVGELAKSLRKHIGIKIDPDKAHNYTPIEDELADVFIYLLDLANACEVDLFEAFVSKEEKNNKRFWGKN